MLAAASAGRTRIFYPPPAPGSAMVKTSRKSLLRLKENVDAMYVRWGGEIRTRLFADELGDDLLVLLRVKLGV